jgi:hypothetical protein
VPPRADRNIPNRVRACAVAVVRTSVWEDAFTGKFTITNRAKTAVNGWSVGWRFRDGARMRHVWNARFNQNGAMVTIRHEGWNGAIPPGGSVSLNFEAGLVGPAADPDWFTLNGVPCADASRGADRHSRR